MTPAGRPGKATTTPSARPPGRYAPTGGWHPVPCCRHAWRFVIKLMTIVNVAPPAATTRKPCMP